MSRLKFAGPARRFDREAEAAVGRPIALLQDGDIIEIDAERRRRVLT